MREMNRSFNSASACNTGACSFAPSTFCAVISMDAAICAVSVFVFLVLFAGIRLAMLYILAVLGIISIRVITEQFHIGKAKTVL